MTEQAPPAEQSLPQEQISLSLVDRVRDSVVTFVKNRLPEEKTERGMKQIDSLVSHLPENAQELAVKIRPVIKAGMYAGNCVETSLEAMLAASVGVGIVAIGKEGLRMVPVSSFSTEVKRKGLGGVWKDLNIRSIPESFLFALHANSSVQQKPEGAAVKSRAKAIPQTSAITRILRRESSPFEMRRPDAKRIPPGYFFRLDYAINDMTDQETRTFLRDALAGGVELWGEFKKSGGRSDRTIPGPDGKGKINVDFALFLRSKFQKSDPTIEADFGQTIMRRIWAKADEELTKRISDTGIQEVLNFIRDDVGIDLRPIYQRIDPKRLPYLMLTDYVIDLEHSQEV